MNLPQTATRQRATRSTDARNNQKTSWTSPDEQDYPCRLVGPSGSESRDQGDRLDLSLSVILPPDADVTAFDRLVVDNLTYEVDGPPLKRYGSAALHHLTVPVRWVSNG